METGNEASYNEWSGTRVFGILKRLRLRRPRTQTLRLRRPHTQTLRLRRPQGSGLEVEVELLTIGVFTEAGDGASS